ncbi:MAG: hypothetical protein KC468_08370, partial [Myxococcales bacterium]|nr:hypothetical protein [Myxococcales bacterium]
LALAACGDSAPAGTITDGDTSDSEAGTTAGASSSSTSSSSTSSSSTSSDGSSSTTGEETTVTTGAPACDPFLEFADVCEEDCECLSGHCYSVPLVGGSCGECKVDADCPDGGCTIPNPWGGEGSMCNGGEAGKGCQTDEVCSDPSAPFCATLIEAPGLFSLMTCSECRTDADCGGATPNCAPEIDLDTFTGIMRCMPDGALMQDQPCVKPDALDPVCETGICSLANVQNVLEVGICGQCLSDADCQPGETCEDAWIDLGGSGIEDLFGSVCM